MVVAIVAPYWLSNPNGEQGNQGQQLVVRSYRFFGSAVVHPFIHDALKNLVLIVTNQPGPGQFTIDQFHFFCSPSN